MGRLDGKVVLVTGGGQGFGRAYCLGLAREGATVAVADINEETANETRSIVEEQGGRAIVAPVDVSDEASVLAMRDAVDSQLGGIDGLVNNAGIFPRIELADITKEMWDHIYNINVWGSFIVARAASHSMRERGGGSIVNISSSTFLTPPTQHAAYMSSKGAIMALTRALATGLAEHHIRVNTILPALTGTEGVMSEPGYQMWYLEQRAQMQLIKRAAAADDVVGAAIFFISDESAFMTGQSLSVTGGTGMQ